MGQPLAGFNRPISSACKRLQLQSSSFKIDRSPRCLHPRLQRTCYNSHTPSRASFATGAAAAAEPASDIPAEEHQYQAEVQPQQS